MGAFLKERRRHLCPVPRVDATLATGSVWECDCGIIWKLEPTDGQVWGRYWKPPYFQDRYRKKVKG